MTALSMRIRLDGNKIVFELIQSDDQGIVVIAADYITREDLKSFLDQ